MTLKVEMVSVVIPTLNEAGNILEALITIEKELAYPKEIIVVDGDSTDGTKEIVKDTNCRLIIEPRRGYGNALRTGMKHAKGDVVVMVDGDGTYEVKHINLLLDKMIKNDAELCIATRMYDPNKAMGFMNFVANKIITFCFDLLYRQFLSDTQSGFRAISHSAIEKVELGEEDMAFATEMLVKFAKKGFKMVEVPSVYKRRKYGKTKLRKIKSGVEIFTTMFRGFMEREYIWKRLRNWSEV
ncbi:glycosyltransferase family 2 protein [Candidatus Bathyarchaeota archaeon]|jgi:dolichol-phosphate mannosyltransferase|nr:glycosyltransferase family 2 protein [Candidatus Bathyarchaeota archaeon]